MYEEVDDSGRGESARSSSVAFGAPFSLTTPLGIMREVKLSLLLKNIL